jgi:hypothetical protein
MLIRAHTRPGGTVLDPGAHPAVVAAARHLGRVPLTPAGPQRLAPPGAVDLFLAGLWPRTPAATRPQANPAAVRLTPHAASDRLGRELVALTRLLTRWRILLRPGGVLITVLLGEPDRRLGCRRSTVIAAARAAGFGYHQHLPVVLTVLPEPAADPGGTDPSPRLHDGRHIPAHRDAVIFTSADGSDRRDK